MTLNQSSTCTKRMETQLDSIEQNGLFFHDVCTRDTILFDSCLKNGKHFSKKEMEQAKRARDLHDMPVCSIMPDCKTMTDNDMLVNCSVTREDINNAWKTVGPDIHGLQGKTVHIKSLPVVEDCVRAPKEISKLHKDATLTADRMNANGPHLCVTLCRKIKCFTVEHVTNRSHETTIECMRHVVTQHNEGGFKTATCSMDPEINNLKAEFVKIC